MIFHKIVHGIIWGFCHLAFRIKTEGLENIPSRQNFVVCANHKSLLDPLVLSVCMPFEMKFMAKEELFKSRLSNAFFRALGAFPVKRGKGDIGALKTAIRVLSGGDYLGIFPEGTRSKNNYMNKGKSGAALIAIKSGVNILPVGISGEYKLFSRLTVRIGKPIDLSEHFGSKVDSGTLQEITDNKLMPSISLLSEVCTYENRNC